MFLNPVGFLGFVQAGATRGTHCVPSRIPKVIGVANFSLVGDDPLGFRDERVVLILRGGFPRLGL